MLFLIPVNDYKSYKIDQAQQAIPCGLHFELVDSTSQSVHARINQRFLREMLIYCYPAIDQWRKEKVRFFLSYKSITYVMDLASHPWLAWKH